MKKILVLLVLALIMFQANSQTVFILKTKEIVTKDNDVTIKDTIYYYEGLMRINKQMTLLTLIAPSGESTKLIVDNLSYSKKENILICTLMDFDGIEYSFTVFGEDKMIVIYTIIDGIEFDYVFTYK